MSRLSADFDLHPNVVRRVVEPRASVIVPRTEPARPDHRDERYARGDLLIERFHEVDAWLDGVNVHEQLLAVEMLQQSVVETACRRLVVAAPVIDKDATGHNVLGVCSIALHVARENSTTRLMAGLAILSTARTFPTTLCAIADAPTGLA